MNIRKISLNLIPILVIALVTILFAPIERAEAATKKDYFSYRVDVLDSSVGDHTENLAVEVSSSVNGTVYIFADEAGKTKLSTAEAVKKVGLDTEIAANEEMLAYGQIDWLNKWKMGAKYDVFIAFEDVNGKLYGPYKKSFVASYFPAGDGSAKNPYKIWTDIHLKNLKSLSGEKVNVKLMQNINMSGSQYTGRIMDYASNFSGVFEGNKHTISGLDGHLFFDIEKGAVVKNLFITNSKSEYSFILARNNRGTIQNCAVVNSSILCSGSDDCGLIAEYNVGTIKNCKAVNSMIDGNSGSLGGIVGRNDGTVTNCYSKVKITDCAGKKAVCGGIAGANYYKTGIISNCVYEPMAGVPFTGQYCGGIVGVINKESRVENCISYYKPKDFNKYPGDASVAGVVKEYFESTNYGTASEEPVAPDSENEKELAKYDELLKVWKCYQGLKMDDTVKKPKDPVSGKVATSNLKATGFTGIKYKLKSIRPNETKAYNKAFKVTTQSFKKVTTKNAPKAVKLNSAKKISDKEIKLSFGKVSGASGYSIYMTNYKYGSYEKYKSDVTTNSFTDNYLSKGKTYYYRVRAYKNVNGRKVYGAFSNVVSCTL